MKWAALAIAIFFLGCNPIELEITQPPEENSFDLFVPEGFTWSGVVQDVLLVTVTQNGNKSFLLDSTLLCLYDEHDMLLDALTIKKGTACFNLRIPAGMQKLVIKAPALNQTVECPAGKKSLNFSIPDSITPEIIRCDMDGDGVFDDFDAVPDNSHITAQVGSHYLELKNQSINGSTPYNYFIFEDSWPLKGDYDYNDVVTGFKYSWSRGKDNFISEIHCQYKALVENDELGVGFELFEARGAYLIYLDEVVTGMDGDVNQYDLQNNLFLLYTDHIMEDFSERSFTLRIADNKLTDLVCLPYLYRKNNPHHQTRSFGVPPTVVQDMGMFNTGNDNSPSSWQWVKGEKFRFPIAGTNAFYSSHERYPWGITFISDNYIPAGDGFTITASYPEFQGWVESGGTTNSNWFKLHN